MVVAPKEVIKELANIGWITNPDEFIDYLKVRNETSHIYEGNKANEAYEASKKFAVSCRALVEILKQKSS